jgi:hypothetical protein
LKSCLLARMIHTGWVFQEKVKVDDCLTHDFGRLIQLAGLTDDLNANQAASAAGNGAFVGHWGTVTQWKVTSRYEPKTEVEAKNLYDAITQEPDGVLKWLQNYW